MVKRPRLGKRKKYTDSTQPPDESVFTQSASATTQSAQADYYDSQAEDIEGELVTEEPTQQSDEPARKKKVVLLMDEEEKSIANWLNDNTVLCNKDKKEYRDVDKKDTLFAAQAWVMEISVEFC